MAIAAAVCTASLLILAACDGTDASNATSRPSERSATVSATAATATAAATSTPTPTPTPTPTSLAGFPLAQGLDGGADSTVTGPSRAAPGIDLEQVCALRIWTGPAQVHVAVQQVPPESAVTRELAVFVSPKAARAVVNRIRTA